MLLHKKEKPMKRLLFSVLMTVLTEAMMPAPQPLPEDMPSERRAEIVCDTAQDGEPFCIVFYPNGEYCTTYRSGYQEGPSCGD